jgi:hypothetical protein
MKFFSILIALSSFLFENLAYPCDVQDTPEPSHLLCSLYSIHHNQLPKNDDPSISYSIQEIPVEAVLKIDLLVSLQEYSNLMMVDIPHAYEYDPCLQPLLIFEHSLYRIFELVNLYSVSVNLPSKYDTDTLLPKQYDMLNYLWSENFFDIQPFSKFKTFIETKVTAIKLQGFNL